jgi:hypothetical protein
MSHQARSYDAELMAPAKVGRLLKPDKIQQRNNAPVLLYLVFSRPEKTAPWIA